MASGKPGAVHGRSLAGFIFQQMKAHYRGTPADYRAKVVRSFRILKPQHFGITSITCRLSMGQAAKPLSDTPTYLF